MTSFPHLFMKQNSYFWSLFEDADVNKTRFLPLRKIRNHRGRVLQLVASTRPSAEFRKESLQSWEEFSASYRWLTWGRAKQPERVCTDRRHPVWILLGIQAPSLAALLPKALGLSCGHTCPTGQGVCAAGDWPALFLPLTHATGMFADGSLEVRETPQENVRGIPRFPEIT